MKLFEMEGFLRGKCIPRDLKVNETNAEYLVRKFAEADAKCAALAAEKEKFAVECAATKIAIAYLKSGRHDFTLNTPATDAFLAEVRAHDLNAFIQHHSAELDAHIKNGGEQFDEKSVSIRDIIVSARLFREQIRKEAAQ
ncbi:TPA: hNH endonuclease [Enterobacter hormaechei]|nr:hNH endonuclease [Enterobacter hormaechei]